MKRIYLLVVMSLLQIQCFYAQENEDTESVKTMDDVRQEIQEWLNNVPEYLKYYEPFSVEISSDAVSQEAEDLSLIESSIATPLKLKNKEEFEKDIKLCYKEKTFYQTITDTATQFDMYDKNCSITVVENSSSYNQILAEDVVVQKLFYRNGKVENVTNPVCFSIPQRVVIDSMMVQAQMRYPVNLRKVTLSAKKPVVKEGKSSFKLIKSDKLKMLFEAENPDGLQIFDVQGKRADGTLINSYNKQVYDEEMQKQKNLFLQYVEVLKQALTKIDKKEFTKVEEVEKFMMDEMPQEGDVITEKVTPNYYYEFSYQVESFDVYYADNFDEQTISATISRIDLGSTTDYFSASAYNEEGELLSGIVDKNGKWLIEPKFSSLYHSADNFFMYWNEDGEPVLLSINDKNQLKEMKGYESVYKLAPNRYQVTIKQKLGVMNQKGEFIIPPAEGNYISYDENSKMFTASDNVGMNLYDYDGKLMFPDKFQNVEFSNSDFITLTPLVKKIVYNKQKQKISDDSWVEASPCFEGTNILYVKNIKGEEFFVNSKGEVVIKPNDLYMIESYNSSQFFRNGMCTIYSKESYKYGCMDMKGNIVIPMEYDVIYMNSDTHVCAQKENETYFIDNKGKVKTKIAAGIYTYDYEPEDYIRVFYVMNNGDVYDSEGNFLRKDTKYNLPSSEAE